MNNVCKNGVVCNRSLHSLIVALSHGFHEKKQNITNVSVVIVVNMHMSQASKG